MRDRCLQGLGSATLVLALSRPVSLFAAGAQPGHATEAPSEALGNAGAENSSAATLASPFADLRNEWALTNARRLARAWRRRSPERRPERAGQPATDPFAALEVKGGLWAARARLARMALSPGAKNAERDDDARLGLPGLRDWLALTQEIQGPASSRSREDLAKLLAFATTTASPILSRAALSEASFVARSPDEKDRVADAFRAMPEGGKRFRIARALAEARVARDGVLRASILRRLASDLPNAPEEAPDLFRAEADHRLFQEALAGSTAEVRLQRAAHLPARLADEAVRLVLGLPQDVELRLRGAELLVDLGRSAESLRLLRTVAFESSSEATPAIRARVVKTAALLNSPGTPVHRGRHTRSREAIVSKNPWPAGEALLQDVNDLLSRGLPETQSRRLREAAFRAELRLGNTARAHARLMDLLNSNPGARISTEELFQQLFALYRSGDADALRLTLRLWEEEASRLPEVAARRRATYWAAKARTRLGDLGGAHAGFASLLSGTSADTYMVWAAQSLGVEAPGAHIGLDPPAGAPEEALLSGANPAAPSRELLACGLPGLAEDAAELEHPSDLDPIFQAEIAVERDDYRGATSLLKSRFPALGTPEEGALLLRVRRLFYPAAEFDLLSRAAAEHNMAPATLFGLVRQESLFTEAARSRSGARGLMQVMPATGRYLARREGLRRRPDLDDPAENVRLGAGYLSQLLELFGGDRIAGLAAYNAGPGRVLRWRRERGSLDRDEFVESIPLSEPRDYVKKVLFFEGAYAALYGISKETPHKNLLRPPAAVELRPSAIANRGRSAAHRS